MFGHLLLKLGGGIDIHAIWKGVSGKAHVYCGGGGEGVSPPPLKIGKKDVVRLNFNLFHLCFTNEIRGESIYMQNGRVGGQAGGEGALPPPLEIEKKKLVLYSV